MKNLLAIVVLIAGLTLAALGGVWIWNGLDIVQVERGWSAVIAGAAMLAGGAVTAAIGIAILRLNEIAGLLAATPRASVVAPVAVPQMVAAAPAVVAPAIVEPIGSVLAVPVSKPVDLHLGDGPQPVMPPSHVGLPGEPELFDEPQLDLAAAVPEPVRNVEDVAEIETAKHDVEEAIVPRAAPPVFIPEIAFSKPFETESIAEASAPLPDAFAAAFPPIKTLRETPAYTSPLSAITPPEPESFAESEAAPEPETPVRRGLVLPKFPERPAPLVEEPAPEPDQFEPPEYRPAAGGEDILPVFPAQSKAWVNASKAAAPPPPPFAPPVTPPAPKQAELRVDSDGPVPVFPPKAAARSAPKVTPRSDIVGTHESGDTTYVMFADGSIEARTVDGSMHFPDLTSLKGYVEREALKPA